MPNETQGLKGQIEREIQQYFTEVVNISDSYDFSQWKLVRRIQLFESKTYPNGKFDSQNNYKFWFDIISPRIDAEIKNTDLDTKDVIVEPPQNTGNKYLFPALITNLFLKNWLKKKGQAEEINDAIEEGSGWGNVIWKKVKGSYERLDLKNTYIINQTVRTLKNTPVIEYHQFQQTDLRKMAGAWKNIDDIISNCGTESYSTSAEAQSKDTTTPYYAIYERNGEVSLADLNEANGEPVKEGDEKIFVLARVIAAGKTDTSGGASKVEIKYILFVSKIAKMPYKEYHRGRYKSRWWREGLYELLFDVQVRANQIGNQISQGLEWASKTIFRSKDRVTMQNILTDMRNGDIIRSADIEQVRVRMQGFDQLANDWNRIIRIANEIANSQEVIQGGKLPSGMPARLGELLDVNATKLYDFLREKFAIPLSKIFEEWIVPKLVNDLKAEDILRITGDTETMDRILDMIVEDWYFNNLMEIGSHTREIADTLKAQKKEELKKRPQLLVSGIQKVFEDFKPTATIVITGENTLTNVDITTLTSVLAQESDPARRSFIIDEILRRKGFDVGKFPKRQIEQPQPAPAEAPLAVT